MKSFTNKISARPAAKVSPCISRARTSVVVNGYASDGPADLDRILEAIAKAQEENVALKKQVAEEGAKAAQTWRDLAKAVAYLRNGPSKDQIARQRAAAEAMAREGRALPGAAPRAAAPAGAPAAPAHLLKDLELEKKRVQELMAKAAEAPKVLAAERANKEAAERKIQELRAKLAETDKGIAASAKEYQKAEAGEKQAINSLDSLDAANQLNEVLKKQLREQIARATEAKEMAANRQRELTAAAAKLREQERMMQKVSKDAQLAIERANKAKEAAQAALAANKELEKKIAAEAERAKAAQQQMLTLKQAGAKISTSAETFKQVIGDAKKIEDVKEILTKTLASNEALRKQVLSEGVRASKAAREFATLSSLAKQTPQLREQMLTERQTRFNAQRAYQQVLAALEEEKKRVQEIIGEAGSTIPYVQDERTARLEAEKAVKALEEKLQAAIRRLDEQSKAIAKAEAEAKQSPDAASPAEVEALEKANALIATLTNQLRGEIARGHAAKDLAAARYKELRQAQEKLKDEQGKLKMASKDTGKFFEQAKKDQEALQAVQASREALQKEIEAEAARAARAEEEARVLSAQAKNRGYSVPAPAPVKPTGTVFELPEDDDEVKASLNKTLDQNKVLTKQVLNEGARAAKASRELAAAHTRINEAEKLIPALKAEISGMKDALVQLKKQMEEVVATKSQRERERERKLDDKLLATAEELKKSQQQVVVAQRAAAELKDSFEVTKSRVSLLEREVAEKHLEVSRR